jgi:hypothetical protein
LIQQALKFEPTPPSSPFDPSKGKEDDRGLVEQTAAKGPEESSSTEVENDIAADVKDESASVTQESTQGSSSAPTPEEMGAFISKDLANIYPRLHWSEES